MGFRDLVDHDNTLLSRWMLRFLDDPTSKWAVMFGVNLKLLKWKEGRIHKRLKYTLKDKILFGEVESFGAYQYTSGLWKAWFELRKAISIR